MGTTPITKTTLADRLRLVCDADLSGAIAGSGVSACAAKMVLMALLRYTDGRGVAWPSRRRLSRDTGLGAARISRVYGALERASILHDATELTGEKRSRPVRVDFDALRPPDERAAHPPRAPVAPGPGAQRATNIPDHHPTEADQEHPPAGGGRGAVAEALVAMGIGREAAERAASRHPGASVGAAGMLALGVDASVVRGLARDRGERAMRDGVRAAAAKGAALRSPAAYAVKACREGWGPGPAAEARERAQRDRDARERAWKRRCAEEDRLQNEQREMLRRGREALERVRAMPADERAAAWASFIDERCSSQGDLAKRLMSRRDPTENAVAARLLVGWMGRRSDGGTGVRVAPVSERWRAGVAPGRV